MVNYQGRQVVLTVSDMHVYMPCLYGLAVPGQVTFSVILERGVPWNPQNPL